VFFFLGGDGPKTTRVEIYSLCGQPWFKIRLSNFNSLKRTYNPITKFFYYIYMKPPVYSPS
jgi:hypothetical protein